MGVQRQLAAERTDADTLQFNTTRGFNGTGMVYVAGKMQINSGVSSEFFGLLYVGGELNIRESTHIHGAVVVAGPSMTVQGSAPNYAIVEYDPDVLADLRRELGQYRYAGAFRPVISRE